MEVIEGGKKPEGCTQVLKFVEHYENRQKVRRYIYCDKVTEEGHALCPHHELLLKEEELERSRRAKKAADTKARKALLAAELEQSPLAAVNPKFTEKKQVKEAKGAYSS